MFNRWKHLILDPASNSSNPPAPVAPVHSPVAGTKRKASTKSIAKASKRPARGQGKQPDQRVPDQEEGELDIQQPQVPTLPHPAPAPSTKTQGKKRKAADDDVDQSAPSPKRITLKLKFKNPKFNQPQNVGNPPAAPPPASTAPVQVSPPAAIAPTVATPPVIATAVPASSAPAPTTAAPVQATPVQTTPVQAMPVKATPDKAAAPKTKSKANSKAIPNAAAKSTSQRVTRSQGPAQTVVAPVPVAPAPSARAPAAPPVTSDANAVNEANASIIRGPQPAPAEQVDDNEKDNYQGTTQTVVRRDLEKTLNKHFPRSTRHWFDYAKKGFVKVDGIPRTIRSNKPQPTEKQKEKFEEQSERDRHDEGLMLAAGEAIHSMLDECDQHDAVVKAKDDEIGRLRNVHGNGEEVKRKDEETKNQKAEIAKLRAQQADGAKLAAQIKQVRDDKNKVILERQAQEQDRNGLIAGTNDLDAKTRKLEGERRLFEEEKQDFEEKKRKSKGTAQVSAINPATDGKMNNLKDLTNQPHSSSRGRGLDGLSDDEDDWSGDDAKAKERKKNNRDERGK